MPLSRVEQINEWSTWALWHIDEEVEELVDLLSPTDEEQHILTAIPVINKKKEWLASRLLVKHLTTAHNILYQGIEKDTNGKPWLINSQAEISISHSYPYAAAIIHLHQAVGIDLEHLRPKLFNVAERVFSLQELQHLESNLHKLCIYWCAKEVLYKIYHQRKLFFKKDLEILPFSLGMEGFLMGIIHLPEGSLEVKIKYIQYPSHIIAFSV